MPSRRNLALISVRSSSPSANATSRSRRAMRTVCARSARRRISIHSFSGSQIATCAKASGSNVASRARFTTRRTLRLKSAVTPAASSYAATRRSVLFHEIGAEEERVAGVEPPRDVGEELGAGLGREVADGAAEERDDARAVARDQVEVTFEVADDRVHFDAVVLGGDRGRGRAQCRLAHVERHETCEQVGVGERVEQQAGLLRRARAELDERVGLGARHDVGGVRDEDAALGARGVVLGKARDLVEQLAATVVVEVLRRQGLR